MTEKRVSAASRYVIMFFFISFLGWTMEMVFCIINSGQFCDRGFLTLPFCTIYGTGVFIVYFLIGTPQKGRLILGWCKNKVLRGILYLILAILIPTAVELVTGLFFEKVLGVTLWTYDMYKFNLWGYVCLEFSLIWGVILTLFMAFAFPTIKGIAAKIPDAAAIAVACVLVAAVAVDLIINLIGI